MDSHLPLPLLVGSVLLRDRQWLAASTLCFLLSFAYTAGTLGDRRLYSAWWNLGLVALGFALQTVFLCERGAAVGRCPLTNHFEVVAFLSWAMVLFYLVVGNTYRLSPLGLFTAPLAFGLQTFAFFLADWTPGDARLHRAGVNPSLEFHAAFSVLSFGAFALAALAGGMYLWQERQLKSHRLEVLFFQLPPISDLIRLNARLLVVGLALLTLGLAAGFNMGTPNAWPHLVWAIVIWGLYAFLVLARRGWGGWRLAPRRVASLSVVAFTFALLTLGGLSFVRI